VVPFLCSSVLPSAAGWSAYFLEAAAGERASPPTAAPVSAHFRAAEAVRAGSPVVRSLAPEAGSRARAAGLADSAGVHWLASAVHSRAPAVALVYLLAVHSLVLAAALVYSPVVHSRAPVAALVYSPVVHSLVLAAPLIYSLAVHSLVLAAALVYSPVVHSLAPVAALVYLLAVRSLVLGAALVYLLVVRSRAPAVALVYLLVVRSRAPAVALVYLLVVHWPLVLAAVLLFYLPAAKVQASRSPSSDMQLGWVSSGQLEWPEAREASSSPPACWQVWPEDERKVLLARWLPRRLVVWE
jgi:hypothetical protein